MARVDARALLAADRDRTLRRLADLREDYTGFVEASRDTNADDEHDPEGHTIAFERSQTGALVRQAERHLAEVDAALDRLAASSYGRCEVCGDAVGDARLEARPTARRCVTCAARR